MSLSSVLMFGAVAGPLAWLAMRDHRAQRTRRRGLLDACTGLCDSHALTHGGDDFPHLEGVCGGRHIDVRLISDGMTIRRLPQLWLQVTELAHLEGMSGLSVLVRPSGYEFYSLTSTFHHVIEAPASFPREVIVRGEDARSEELLERLAAPMAAILADARVKEIAVTRRGLRIIRQAGEGRRGEYLLLRQAVFDTGAVAAETLAGVLEDLDALRVAVAGTPARKAVPA